METELTVLVAAMLIASARGDLRDKKSLMNAPILIVLKGLWMRAALFPAALIRASHTPEIDANREDCFFCTLRLESARQRINSGGKPIYGVAQLRRYGQMPDLLNRLDMALRYTV
jgi:hypothetical protein